MTEATKSMEDRRQPQASRAAGGSLDGATASFDKRLARFLSQPRLAAWVVGLGLLLTSPSLFTGFQFDDVIGRFIFSDQPGAERLSRIYAGGYGAANGDPVDAAWMVEQGFAPWWIDRDVLVAFYRPVSLVTHLLDAELWPNSAFMWHAHSLLWFALLLYATYRMYGSIQGPVIGGLAALLFAVDHAHGMAVGFSTNRYILIATAFGMFTLHQHHRYRTTGSMQARWLAPLSYAVALLAGESSAAFVGYLLGYALFVESGNRRERALSLVPYFVITIGWRMLYNGLGRGARGSDLYIDPGREPLAFLEAALTRGPMLLLGQWGAPAAEAYTWVEPPLTHLLIALAWAFTIIFVIAIWTVVKRDKLARFWATGMFLALVPMCAGEPNNRMLFTAGIGAWGLLAQWWQLNANDVRASARSGLAQFSRGFGTLMLWAHLFVAPLLLPINVCSLAFLGAINRAAADVGPEATGREAVFVTTPDYFAVRLTRMTKEVEGQPTPERWRGLSFGPEQVTLQRVSDQSLILEFEGGAMSKPGMTKQVQDLYRSHKAPMSAGHRVSLEGLNIEVLEVTPDGRPLRVRFDFAASLDAERYRFYQWVDNGFRVLAMPPVGAKQVLPPAILAPELTPFG